MPYSIHVWVPSKKTWVDFLAFVFSKHGKNHQVTGEELERALKLVMALEGWMDYSEQINFVQGTGSLSQDPYNTHTNLSNRQLKLSESFKKTFWFVNKISDDNLTNFIKDELDVIDDRTVDKYIDFLKRRGFIAKKPRATKWKVNFPREESMDMIMEEILNAKPISENRKGEVRRI